MTHHFELKDKVAIVTGGGTGIGKAMVLVMAREGSRYCRRRPSGGSHRRDRQGSTRTGGGGEVWLFPPMLPIPSR